MNPGVGPFNNFADYTSAVSVIADVELPFWGTAENFTIRDTINEYTFEKMSGAIQFQVDMGKRGFHTNLKRIALNAS